MKKLLLLLSFCAAATIATAKVELPTVLGSGMVLQQKSDASLWGKAKPNSTVTVTTSWDKAKKAVKADAQGAWLAKVATPAFGGPYSISISDGDPALVLDNVLIGEVWVCSGQSNMEMPVIGFQNQPIDGSTQTIVNACSEKNIRMYNVEKATSATPQFDCKGQWNVSTPESVANISATAYFFALNLTHSLDGIPVGIIVSSWGGTAIQPWMPAACSERVMNDDYLKSNPSDQHENRRMGYLYNAMICPIKNFTARGFLWYQGETNLGNNGIGKNGTRLYANLMQEMVAQWRADWGDKNNSMPFYYVQIAPFNYDNPNSMTRGLFVENQVDALKLIPNSGMAGTNDIGHPTCIHPAQKDKVGERLALLAMAQTYGIAKTLPVNGPTVKKFEFKDGCAFVEFERITGGFKAKNLTELTGFDVCGEDKVFYPATKAGFINNFVVSVSSDKVAKPIAVRYAFRNYVETNLFNTLGIPPFSFRSDNF